MRKFVLAGLTCAGILALLPDTAMAHGGQYRGPGDVVPPSPGGGRGTGGPSGPTTGGPGGPSTPGPAGPATPGPAGPATGGPSGPAGGRGPTTGGGAQLDDDLTRWEFWWEFNKDPFIRLKDAIHTGGIQTGSDEFFLGATKRVESKDSLRPSKEDKLNNILPALKKAMESTDQRDITSSCMIAMAKIGENHTDFTLKSVFEPCLKKNDQEIRETAALAFGISALAEEDNVKLLVSLAKDDADGRKASGGSDVNERTRAFATYGLGLIAHATTSTDVKRKVFDALKDLLTDEKFSGRQIKVAAVNAIGLLNAKGNADADKNLVADALKALEDYYSKDLGPGELQYQSHVPPAIAKLIGRDHEKSDHYKAMFAEHLEGKGKRKTSNEQAQSCAMALGQMVKPYDDEKAADAKYVKLLLDSFHDHKDKQTKYFSILALGQIGGKELRNTLVKEFEKAKALEKGWAAIAMGVFAFKKYEAAKATQSAVEIENAFGDSLKGALDEKNPSALAGITVALGLCQYLNAADAVRALLSKKKSDDELAGYLCIGLALMNDTRSIEDIRQIVQEAVRRPDLLKQAAIALGKLGDKTVADELQKHLTSDEAPNLAKLSAVASALGFIGDRRTIEPLKKMLFDEQATPLSRAFAAVALGGVADKEQLPWNSKIGVNMNYRASVETLTDRVAGILDIL
ncbi:MAG: HEAT repeat domain-containing protein [Planctomycetes bacterium]|nr:HEAT repeat domain-containing protein [Planctomycetota bacterium]